MFRFDEGLKVYLHRAPIDFRLNINGLALLVEQSLGLDPFAASVYVFGNRRRNRPLDTLRRDGSLWLRDHRLQLQRVSCLPIEWLRDASRSRCFFIRRVHGAP